MDSFNPSGKKFLGIIPARYGSTRFPGKPLIDINGKSMVCRVYEQALLSGIFESIIVATDDHRIIEHVKSAGHRAVMTSSAHRSGTDRCLEALDIQRQSTGMDFDFVINLQGDEPFIPPDNIRQVAVLLAEQQARIASLVKPVTRREDIFNPNVVKAVFNANYHAQYFSRSPIPYLRETPETQWAMKKAHFKHIGIYGYRSEVLREICQLPPGRLETAESLEQLRWLEAGIPIRLDVTTLESISIDTPEDLLKITNMA
jgi:3-deoxy-manno-octulosonate cytidylyltransferase (CMP-KDO synthetase)